MSTNTNIIEVSSTTPIQEQTFYSSTPPSSTTGYSAGDVLFVTPLGTKEDSANATEMWRFDGTKWVKVPSGSSAPSGQNVYFDADNTIELLVAKVNENTVNYGDLTAEEIEANNLFLKSYIDFVALQIESYKAGDISIDEINTIEAFATDKVVKITYLDEEFSLLAFVKELIETEDKAPVLSGCMASITAAIEGETQG